MLNDNPEGEFAKESTLPQIPAPSFPSSLHCHSWTRWSVIPEWVNKESTFTLLVTLIFQAKACLRRVGGLQLTMSDGPPTVKRELY